MVKKFNTFDRVLIKDSDGIWQIDFYSYKDSDDLHHVMTYGESNSFINYDILPYEGNEELVGTTNSPDEEVRLEEGEFIIASDYIDELSKGLGNTAIFTDVHSNRYIRAKDSKETYGYKFCIRFSDFNPNDMEATKTKILCVKGCKVVKYKG